MWIISWPLTGEEALHWSITAVASCKCCYFLLLFCCLDIKRSSCWTNRTKWSTLPECFEWSLSIFFRSYICPILLGYKEWSFCVKCEKVLLEQNEIEKGQDEIDHNSIQCDQCMCWYHYKCQALQLKDANTLGGDNWHCNLCLRSQESNI